ncbi:MULTISPECIES: hypothetical protein [unclassified Butyrivibrio]|uniref:hypothetical protein n=1 Tax=unclassified Butyrivibrio TaxID=2639466 RepID=UPI0004085C86|nr:MULTISPECIES: hypothetical protein [unclassified Butyrivibrio]
MRDRRNYDRIELGNMVLLFLEGHSAEIKGTVTNLSEESIGIKFHITPELEEIVKELKTIQFQFVDSYTEGGKKKTDIIQACTLITRIEIQNGECFIGGIVRDDSYKKYVIHRKISMYYK